MRKFGHFLAIDWSGAKGERQRGIALALSHADGGPPVLVTPPPRGWARLEVLEILRDHLPPDTLVGMDMGISLPFADAGAFFPEWRESPADAPALWALIDEICRADPHLQAGSVLTHPEIARYFRHGKGDEGDRFHLAHAPTREGRFRRAEHAQRAQGVRPVSNFNLVGAAQVGKSTLTGMRMLHHLRGAMAVWPVDPLPETGPVLVEIYTSIAARSCGVANGRSKIRNHQDLNAALARIESPAVPASGPIDDHSSDALITAAWLRHVAQQPHYWQPDGLTPHIAQTEGWTFGAV